MTPAYAATVCSVRTASGEVIVIRNEEDLQRCLDAYENAHGLAEENIRGRLFSYLLGHSDAYRNGPVVIARDSETGRPSWIVNLENPELVLYYNPRTEGHFWGYAPADIRQGGVETVVGGAFGELAGSAIANAIVLARGLNVAGVPAYGTAGSAASTAREAAVTSEGTATATSGARLADDLAAQMEKPIVSDSNLARLIEVIYRPGAQIGSGSTAAAVRHELATGSQVGGRLHTQKAQDYSTALQKWINNNPNASFSDRSAAQNILRDMQNALSGR